MLHMQNYYNPHTHTLTQQGVEALFVSLVAIIVVGTMLIIAGAIQVHPYDR